MPEGQTLSVRIMVRMMLAAKRNSQPTTYNGDFFVVGG